MEVDFGNVARSECHVPLNGVYGQVCQGKKSCHGPKAQASHPGHGQTGAEKSQLGVGMVDLILGYVWTGFNFFAVGCTFSSGWHTWGADFGDV